MARMNDVRQDNSLTSWLDCSLLRCLRGAGYNAWGISMPAVFIANDLIPQAGNQT